MSRTDAHRPLIAWLNDHPDLVREVHDHTTGPCTLPVAPFTADDLAWRPRTCHVMLDPGVRLCACPLCTGRFATRAGVRAARAATRAWLRAAVTGADLEELEVLEGRVHQQQRRRW